jgi:hypothetical protein
MPTPVQLDHLYRITRQLTTQFRGYIRLVDLLPNHLLCIVCQPREFIDQRIIVYISPDGEVNYV